MKVLYEFCYVLGMMFLVGGKRFSLCDGLNRMGLKDLEPGCDLYGTWKF